MESTNPLNIYDNSKYHLKKFHSDDDRTRIIPFTLDAIELRERTNSRTYTSVTITQGINAAGLF